MSDADSTRATMASANTTEAAANEMSVPTGVLRPSQSMNTAVAGPMPSAAA